MPPELFPIAVIVVLILLNGLFVAAEFAVAGVSRTAITQRAAQGNRRARVVEGILGSARNQDRYIATAQLGITFASLGLGMYGEHTVATWIYNWFDGGGFPTWIVSHTIASIIAIAIFTYFHIVIGEMIPKALALSNAERTALAVTPLMLWVKRLMFPLVLGLNGIGNGILRVFGIRRELNSDQYYTPMELQYIVRESGEAGQLRSDAAQFIDEVFEFGELRAKDAMVPRVTLSGIPLGAEPQEIRRILVEANHTRYPVFDGDLDDIVGMVHTKDLLILLREGRVLDATVVRKVPFVPQTSKLDVVLQAMREYRTQMVIVMDEQGGTAGVLTIEDLFEEIVGEITEEPAEDARVELPGEAAIEGTDRLEEAGEQIGLSLESDEVDTVSGLVMMLLDRAPVPGDRVTYRTVEIEVRTVEGRGVGEAVIRRLPEDQREEAPWKAE